MPTHDLRVDGATVVHRLHDSGDEVRLDAVLDLLATSAPERIKLVRGEARDVEIGARIYEVGVAALRRVVRAPHDLPWNDYVNFGMAAQGARANVAVLDHHV